MRDLQTALIWVRRMRKGAYVRQLLALRLQCMADNDDVFWWVVQVPKEKRPKGRKVASQRARDARHKLLKSGTTAKAT